MPRRSRAPFAEPPAPELPSPGPFTEIPREVIAADAPLPGYEVLPELEGLRGGLSAAAEALPVPRPNVFDLASTYLPEIPDDPDLLSKIATIIERGGPDLDRREFIKQLKNAGVAIRLAGKLGKLLPEPKIEEPIQEVAPQEDWDRFFDRLGYQLNVRDRVGHRHFPSGVVPGADTAADADKYLEGDDRKLYYELLRRNEELWRQDNPNLPPAAAINPSLQSEANITDMVDLLRKARGQEQPGQDPAMLREYFGTDPAYGYTDWKNADDTSKGSPSEIDRVDRERQAFLDNIGKKVYRTEQLTPEQRTELEDLLDTWSDFQSMGDTAAEESGKYLWRDYYGDEFFERARKHARNLAKSNPKEARRQLRKWSRLVDDGEEDNAAFDFASDLAYDITGRASFIKDPAKWEGSPLVERMRKSGLSSAEINRRLRELLPDEEDLKDMAIEYGERGDSVLHGVLEAYKAELERVMKTPPRQLQSPAEPTRLTDSEAGSEYLAYKKKFLKWLESPTSRRQAWYTRLVEDFPDGLTADNYDDWIGFVPERIQQHVDRLKD